MVNINHNQNKNNFHIKHNNLLNLLKYNYQINIYIIMLYKFNHYLINNYQYIVNNYYYVLLSNFFINSNFMQLKVFHNDIQYKELMLY